METQPTSLVVRFVGYLEMDAATQSHCVMIVIILMIDRIIDCVLRLGCAQAFCSALFDDCWGWYGSQCASLPMGRLWLITIVRLKGILDK